MVEKKELEDKTKTNSSVLVIIISFLLLVSIAISVLGVLNGKKEVSSDSEEKEILPKDELQSEELNNIFQKEFSERSNSKVDEYYLNDPFKEICASTSGDDIPAISGGTVCVR
jgi:flagellar basal body-associated protein FliL